MNQWIPLGPPSPPLPTPSIPESLVFSGDRREFFRLVARGAGLELVTVGFYRFWLATDIRRHLWSNTQVDGDAAEYTGRGKELLIGFLFALAIIVPVYLAYFIAGLEAERLKAFASFPLLLFLYVFGQFAIYRARRYRLTRTVWRGVRFWMDGSGWAYAARAALWMVLIPLTLGLILPWREAALERYKMRHCYYGDLQGSFEGRGWDFFKQGWGLWVLAVASLIMLGFAKIIPFGPLLVLVAAPFIYAGFKAVEWRWWLSGIRFGRVRFESDLWAGELAGLYWKMIGWSLLIAALFVAYLFACASLIAKIDQTPIAKLFAAGNLKDSIPMIVLAVVGYLIFILAMNVVMRVYLLRDLWMRVVQSVTVHDLEAVANVSAKGELASALGEGLADGLDVVGF
jgi:uncharacterized membrane protein YjgN (DUF898 family)